jgi:4'-phosphopantetheinyl transferase
MSAGDAHVWVCSVPALALSGHLAGYPALLSTQENDRASRYRHAVDRESYLAAHGLLRTALSWCEPTVAAQQWRFMTGPYGRPEVASPDPSGWLRFNISHTDGLVGCVVTAASDCGIDVERWDRRTDVMSLTRGVLSVREFTELMDLPAADRGRRFHEHWVLKEAYVKARGLGMHLPLDRCGFLLGGKTVRARLPESTAPWVFDLWRPTSRHVAALALRSLHGASPQPVRHTGSPPLPASRAGSPRSSRIAETTGDGAPLR